MSCSFGCFSETSVDILTALGNLFLLLTANEKPHTIKTKIKVLMPLSPQTVAEVTSFFFVFISLCKRLSFNLSFFIFHFKTLSCSDSFLNPFQKSVQIGVRDPSQSEENVHIWYMKGMHAWTQDKRKVSESSEGNKQLLYPQVTAVHQTALWR